MRRLVVLSLFVALGMSPAGFAQHQEAIAATGTIKGPAPVSWLFYGLTESQNPCGEPSPDLGDLQGLDGWWIPLPVDEDGDSLLTGHAATLTTTSPTAVDVDVWFYDAGCSLLLDDPGSYSMASHPWGTGLPGSGGEQNATPNEQGTIPEFAAWAIVDLTAGANVTFTFSVPVQ